MSADLPSFVRRGLLVVLLIGLIGTSVELLLLVHYEDTLQMVPLALSVTALMVLGWVTTAPGPGAVAVMKIVMAGFVAAGLMGVSLHFQANAEFQRDIDPAITGADLFWKVVQAKAPPALAPGVMVQLGLVGWLYAVLQDGRREDVP